MTYDKPIMIAHRGDWWPNRALCNTPGAVARALAQGWGVEIDIWHDGDMLRVGHGVDDHSLPLQNFHTAWEVGAGPILWNVKGVGIDRGQSPTLLAQAHRSWMFDFELIDPELPSRCHAWQYLFRASEREPLAHAIHGAQELSLRGGTHGVWLDTFEVMPHVTAEMITEVRQAGLLPIVVSPELHQHPIDLRQWQQDWRDAYAICTDHPEISDTLTSAYAHPHQPWWDVHG